MGSEHRGREPLKALVVAQGLERHTYQKCKGGRAFPKTMRAGLPLRMENTATDIVADIMEANELDLRDPVEAAERIACQRRALRALNRMAAHVELAHAMGYLGVEEFDHWAGLATDAKRACLAWHKADRKRLGV